MIFDKKRVKILKKTNKIKRITPHQKIRYSFFSLYLISFATIEVFVFIVLHKFVQVKHFAQICTIIQVWKKI